MVVEDLQTNADSAKDMLSFRMIIESSKCSYGSSTVEYLGGKLLSPVQILSCAQRCSSRSTIGGFHVDGTVEAAIDGETDRFKDTMLSVNITRTI